MLRIFASLVFGCLTLIGTPALAGEHGSSDEAVAMVREAVNFIKTNGREKGFAEINNQNGRFKDRDLYVVVYDMNGKNIAHGGNPRMIGKDMIELKDVDGRYFIKERVEMMKTKKQAWQDYKFVNPVSRKIEPKSMYLERFEDVIVACGVYKS